RVLGACEARVVRATPSLQPQVHAALHFRGLLQIQQAKRSERVQGDAGDDGGSMKEPKKNKKKVENHLYYGDNLTRMQQMAKHSVDLIYLDPPFNSKQNYNLIYKNMTGKPVPDQADAFCDTWEMDAEKEELAKAMPVLMREM